MAYQYITKYDSPNFGYPDGVHGGNKPERIVIHHWGADSSTFDGTIAWLCNGNRSDPTSAHFVVEAGRVACIVDWCDCAWHAGDKYVNQHSIGIECCPLCRQGDMQTVAEVIAMLWKEYGKLPLCGHKDIVSTTCPGRWYNKLDQLYRMAQDIYDDSPAPDPKPEIDMIDEDGIWGYDTTLGVQRKLGLEIQDGVLSYQYSGNIGCCILSSAINENGWHFVDHMSSIGSTTVRALQSLTGASVDGILGPDTIRHLQRFLGVAADSVLGRDTVSALQRWVNAA